MLLINNSYKSFLTNITFKKDVLSDFKSRAEQCFTWSWLFLFEFSPKGEFFSLTQRWFGYISNILSEFYSALQIYK